MDFERMEQGWFVDFIHYGTIAKTCHHCLKEDSLHSGCLYNVCGALLMSRLMVIIKKGARCQVKTPCFHTVAHYTGQSVNKVENVECLIFHVKTFLKLCLFWRFFDSLLPKCIFVFFFLF